jgi:deoxyribonuclease-1-like protein
MASQARRSRSRSGKSRAATESTGSKFSFKKSWITIATMIFGSLGSYFGFTSNETNNLVTGDPNATVTNPAYPGYGEQPVVSSTVAANNATITNPNPPANPLERDSILIGSFNIQIFGKAKMSRPDVVGVLVDIARRFDILAIQELRDSKQETIPEFLRLINANGARFEAAVSPSISYGQGSNSEQLVYIYDSEQIELLSAPQLANDRQQVMFRPPFMAHFRYRSRYRAEAFSFVLLNVHTSPQQTAKEFSALEDIFQAAYATYPEDDFILLGDLNEEPGKYLRYRWLNNQFAAIPSHWKTNTAETKNYDNFVFDLRRTAEFTGQSGVLNLKTYYRLTREQADLVSDHMPVWALFSSREAPPDNIVQQPSPAVIR